MQCGTLFSNGVPSLCACDVPTCPFVCAACVDMRGVSNSCVCPGYQECLRCKPKCCAECIVRVQSCCQGRGGPPAYTHRCTFTVVDHYLVCICACACLSDRVCPASRQSIIVGFHASVNFPGPYMPPVGISTSCLLAVLSRFTFSHYRKCCFLQLSSTHTTRPVQQLTHVCLRVPTCHVHKSALLTCTP